MVRISEKYIKGLIQQVSDLSGENLTYEYNNIYGGYRLILIDDKLAHRGAFGQSSSMERMKPTEFRLYLLGLIGGLEHKNK